MSRTYHKFDLSASNESRASNRRALADGVQGVKCTATRAPDERETGLLPLLPADTETALFSEWGVEEYANGGKNVMVRDGHGGVLIGFVKVR